MLSTRMKQRGNDESERLITSKETIMKVLLRATLAALIVGVAAVMATSVALADEPYAFEQIQDRTQLAQYQSQLMDRNVLLAAVAQETDGGPAQISDRNELAQYQAELADSLVLRDAPTINVVVVAQGRFEQIGNRSELAEYQAFLADSRPAADGSMVQVAFLSDAEFDRDRGPARTGSV